MLLRRRLRSICFPYPDILVGLRVRYIDRSTHRSKYRSLYRMEPFSENDIVVTAARLEDLDSLSTVVQRSFHFSNAYIRSALPDTSRMREWWTDIFREEIQSPECFPIVATDTKTQQVVGFLCQRKMTPTSADPIGGFWTKHPWTEDHDESKWRFIMDSNCHWEEVEMQKSRGEYFHIELCGVDEHYQRRGIGKRLHHLAAAICDANHCASYTQSGGAKEYYEKLGLGFKTLEKPEFAGYQAFISVRDARKVDDWNAYTQIIA